MGKSLLANQKLKKGKQISNKNEMANLLFTKQKIKRPRLWMSFLMVASDLIAWMLALVVAILMPTWLHIPNSHHSSYYFLPIFYFIFAYAGGLYSMLGLNPVDEMRKLFYALSASITLAVLMIFFFPQSAQVEPFILLMLWGFLFFFILFSRWITRIFAVRLKVWGEPVAVMAQNARAEKFADYFGARSRLGILPSMLICDNPTHEDVNTISLNDFLALPEAHFSLLGINTLLLDMNAFRFLVTPEIRHKITERFPKIIFMADMDWLNGASFHVRDFEGISGFEARRNSLSPTNSFFKRGMDIAGTLVLGLVSAPIWLLTMLTIRFDSKAPIFYTQERIGKDGKTIRIFKFRTMVENAEQKLEEYLAQNPDAKEEWNATQKLRNDLRITKPGCWIRKLSIDELPQLVNILKGEMSLVGPRPMMLDQTVPYGDSISAYHSVRPGLTGMWQVSGRNNTTFAERAKFDLYYVNNWSIWLDIYILLRTLWVVITQDGAN